MPGNATSIPSSILNCKEATFLVIFSSIQIIFGSTTNAFEIIFFCRKRHKHNSVSDKLTLNLAVADFVALTTYLPWRTYLLHIRRRTDDYKYYTSLFVFCIFNTGNAILLIGIDRFMAVIRPLRYHALITDKKAWVGVVLAWITAFLLGIGHYMSYKEMLDIHTDYELFLAYLSLGQLAAMTVIYSVILKAARKQVEAISLPQTRFINPDATPDSWTDLHSRKYAYTTFCIVCFFYATFLPYSLYRIISTFDLSITDTSKRITWRWLISFTFLNSCLNPFIYFIGMKKFRSGLKRSFNIDSNNETTVL